MLCDEGMLQKIVDTDREMKMMYDTREELLKTHRTWIKVKRCEGVACTHNSTSVLIRGAGSYAYEEELLQEESKFQSRLEEMTMPRRTCLRCRALLFPNTPIP